MNSNEWAFDEHGHLWLPYCQMKTAPAPLDVVATQEEFLQLASGQRLIDGIASWWTACHGYNHPHIRAAVVGQLSRMPHVMLGGLCHEPARKLSQRLANLLPGKLSRVFFCDSGSVAVEVALKTAVQFWINRGEATRKRFVCFHGSYHGDTTGAMSVCDPVDSMHRHFKGFLLDQFPAPIPQDSVELSRFDAFLSEHETELAGVIIEPLAQMATGMRFHTADQLAGVFACCRRHGLLFIADEIATGFGRTGTMFAMEQANIEPDIVCLGKALTGGTLSLAATISSEEVYGAFHDDDPAMALMHGPTYMGNPLACAAASASLDLFEREPRLEQVATIAAMFHDFARELSVAEGVIDARCLGAILAITFDRQLTNSSTRDFFVERGVWLRPIHNVLYVCPPFTIRSSSLQTILDAIAEFAAQLRWAGQETRLQHPAEGPAHDTVTPQSCGSGDPPRTP